MVNMKRIISTNINFCDAVKGAWNTETRITGNT